MSRRNLPLHSSLWYDEPPLDPLIDGVGGDAKACMAVYNIVADTPHALNPFDRFTQICLFGVKSCISNETESELGVCCE